MAANTRQLFFSGTSNIVLPLRQSEFPPEYSGASRLTYYASLFNSLEVNATFYKLPKPATVRSWSESVPEDFRFTFKVPKTVTHCKELQFPGEELARFAEVISGAESRKGCVLVQFPPSLKIDRAEELDGLLEGLQADTPGWKIAVEFRHLSWYTRDTWRLLQRYGAAMVFHDMPASAPPQTVLSDFVFVRYHGPDGDYRGGYSDERLRQDGEQMKAWMREGKEVYAYFNNTIGDAFANLQTLNAHLGHGRT